VLDHFLPWYCKSYPEKQQGICCTYWKTNPSVGGFTVESTMHAIRRRYGLLIDKKEKMVISRQDKSREAFFQPSGSILQSNMVLSVSPFHFSQILSSDGSLIVLASSLK
jgi:hypothetical protein